jgi:hypothetical protein
MSLNDLADTLGSIGGDVLIVVGIGVAVVALIFGVIALAKGNMKKAIVSIGTAVAAAVIGVAGIGIVVSAAGTAQEIVQNTDKGNGEKLFDSDKKISELTD